LVNQAVEALKRYLFPALSFWNLLDVKGAMPERFFIIDGHSQCYQAYYAISDLTSPRGIPVNAVYGFTLMLRKLLKEQTPEYLVAVFDSEGPTFRHLQYEAYKAHRKETPGDFTVQIPFIYKILRAYNIPTYEYEGYEADDLIGTLAKQASQQGLEVYIVTADKDLEQLIDTHIKIYNARKEMVLDLETLKRERGIAPEQVTDFLALKGDDIDNVPGVPGIGEKTAKELLHQFGSLDGILNNIDNVKGERNRERLKTFAERARQSKRLVTIDTHAPVELNLEACRRDSINEKELRGLFSELGFKTLLAQMGPAKEKKEVDYRIVNTLEGFRTFMEELRKPGEFALDLETTSLQVAEARIVGLSFSWEEGQGWYLPLLAPLGETSLDPSVLEKLKPILEDQKVKKIGQNLKYDYSVLRNYGIRLKGIAFDTMVASYLLSPTRRRHNLDELAMEYLSHPTTPITELIGHGKAQLTMDKVELKRIANYACEDADIAYRLAGVLCPLLEKEGLLRLFEEVEMPLVTILAEMEHTGIRIDSNLLKEMSSSLEKRLKSLEEDIFRQAGERFNVDSPRQIAHVLFKRLGLEPIRHTKTGPSTVAKVLESLARQHPLPALLVEHRQLSKLKSTYMDALPRGVSNGKVHASFNQTVTATGRLSSSEPNLQNIPIRTDLGRQIRRAFVPSREGLVFLALDYSQIELRILAHYSEDPALLKAFQEDQDIHNWVASQLYGVGIGQVSPEMRRTAKAVNFGIIYGLSPMGLSRELGISIEEARGFIESYFNLFQGVKRFREDAVLEARQRGWVSTLLGRRRPIPGINSPNKQKRGTAERVAINTIIQGSAADLIKVAMVMAHRRLEEIGSGAKLLIQIHDELLFELPEEELATTTRVLQEVMTMALPLRVPVKVNVKVGKNWMEVE
jgi:DNA polymerase-1